MLSVTATFWLLPLAESWMVPAHCPPAARPVGSAEIFNTWLVTPEIEVEPLTNSQEACVQLCSTTVAVKFMAELAVTETSCDWAIVLPGCTTNCKVLVLSVSGPGPETELFVMYKITGIVRVLTP